MGNNGDWGLGPIPNPQEIINSKVLYYIINIFILN